MKVKTALFVLIFLMVLLIPPTVFAANTEKKCGDYDSSKYTLVGYAVGDGTPELVEGNPKVSEYFKGKFSNMGAFQTKLTLFFSYGDSTYVSEASIAKNGSVKCSGKLVKVQGVTQTTPISEQDPETLSATLSSIKCSDLKATELYTKVLNPAYKFIRIAVPSLLVLLCSYDFVTAMIADNADKMKKAQQRAAKRIIVGIVIFLLPSLLDALLGLFGDFSTCGIGM